MYTVDVDTGGTMTDGLVADGTTRHTIKVDTTPHDLTVSFRQVLVEAAKTLGYGEDLGAFLDQVTLIRWSTTITSNVLGEKRGAKVGLVVRNGHEENLYGAERSPAVGTLVADHNVLGLADDRDGQAILEAVKGLLADGVRRICVSLDGAFPDNASERFAKQVVESQYPDHFLGAVPVLLGSEMAQVGDDRTRTHCSVINAYVHPRLAGSLFEAEDLLKYQEGWDGPLLIGHINGGVARVSKTKAFDTIESGPVFGTHASAFWARRYGLDNVVCLDVGGTTAKASVVRDGAALFTRDADLFGIPVSVGLPLMRSAVLGGGTVARVSSKGGVQLGPDSMGAAPGPACYGLGGDEATVTDAFLLLGYLDASRFLDGRRELDVDKSRQVIESKLAKGLGGSVEEAAAMVADAATDVVVELVRSTLDQAGLSPKDVALFSYGGNGALFAASVAERLGIPVAYVFALGPVFSAFGSSVSDVMHVYERSLGVDPGLPEGEERVRGSLEELATTARRDLTASGFDPEAAVMDVELDVRTNGSTATAKGSGEIGGAEALEEALAGAKKADRVDVVRLRASYRMAPAGETSPAQPSRAHVSDSATPADDRAAAEPVGERTLNLAGVPVTAPVYDWTNLRTGATIAGPALAAGGTMTCLLPPGWSLSVDDFGNGVLRSSAKS